MDSEDAKGQWYVWTAEQQRRYEVEIGSAKLTKPGDQKKNERGAKGSSSPLRTSKLT